MEDKYIEVSMRIKVTQEDVDDIMSGALEGGITYWCDRVKIAEESLGAYASEQISRGGELKIYDYEGEAVYTLNLEKLLEGIKLWAENPVGYNCLVQEDGKLQIDCCNADAAVCDAIIQYALFGEIVYS